MYSGWRAREATAVTAMREDVSSERRESKRRDRRLRREEQTKLRREWGPVGKSVVALAGVILALQVAGSVAGAGEGVDMTPFFVACFGLHIRSGAVSWGRAGVVFFGLLSLLGAGVLLGNLGASPIPGLSQAGGDLQIYLSLLWDAAVLPWMLTNTVLIARGFVRTGVRFWTRSVIAAVVLLILVPAGVFGVRSISPERAPDADSGAKEADQSAVRTAPSDSGKEIHP
jgi:hypothetical protein